MTVLCTTPWFIVGKHRPGQKLPDGTKWWQAGPRQVYQAARYLKDLKQPLLYLIAYFLLQECEYTAAAMLSSSFRDIFQCCRGPAKQDDQLQYIRSIGAEPRIVSRRRRRNRSMPDSPEAIQDSGQEDASLRCHHDTWTVSRPAQKILMCSNLWGVIGAYTQTIGFHHGRSPWQRLH